MKIYKGYQIKPDKQYPNNCVIVTDGRGGKIPNVLDGLFTSVRIGMEAIDKYLMGKPEKDVPDDKEISKGRSK